MNERTRDLVERARVQTSRLDGFDRFDDRQLLRLIELGRGVEPEAVLEIVRQELARRRNYR